MEHREVIIPVNRVDEVIGELTVPPSPKGLVLFIHGSGSSRQSPRNLKVSNDLLLTGLATLLIDLLTESEAFLDQRTAQFRFNIPLLTKRIVDGIHWLTAEPRLNQLPLGLYGASTGAAAAIRAASEDRNHIKAIVSRGGRPDLAGVPFLHSLKPPTLFVVGAKDSEVLSIHQRILAQLTCPKELTIIPQAGHLFQEPGTLDEVARHTTRWFHTYLGLKEQASFSFPARQNVSLTPSQS